MSIIHFLIRRLSFPFFMGMLVVAGAFAEASGQNGGRGRGNARVMDLSFQFDEARDKIACLGDPNTVHVKPGDVLVLRARGTFVNDVTWDSTVVDYNKHGKPSLAINHNLKNSGPFEKGAAFAFVINSSIRDTTAYELNVMCGDKKDDPPKVIVDP